MWGHFPIHTPSTGAYHLRPQSRGLSEGSWRLSHCVCRYISGHVLNVAVLPTGMDHIFAQLTRISFEENLNFIHINLVHAHDGLCLETTRKFLANIAVVLVRISISDYAHFTNVSGNTNNRRHSCEGLEPSRLPDLKKSWLGTVDARDSALMRGNRSVRRSLCGQFSL